MLITLNNGKTVEISFEKYIEMSDEKFQLFLEDDHGEVINDPFFQSQVHREHHKSDYDD